MTYGVDFCVLDPVTGERLPGLLWPLIRAFAYPDNGSRGFWLKEDFTVEFVFRGMRWRMTVRAGFDFDGASIPRWAWSIIGDPLALDILIAALFHDILFCAHHPAWPLHLTNALFLEIQQACGSRWIKRNTTTKVVQAAGWALWKKSDADLAKYRAMLIAVPGRPT